MKHIAIGQILQETNTLNPVLTQRSDVEAYGLVQGEGVVEEYGDVGELAGFAAMADVLGERVDWLGLCRAVAWSGGPLSGGLMAELIELTTAPLRDRSVDGVLLSLHGAQSSIDDPDVSGRVLEAARRAVGAATPVVATLDLHANVTPLMVEAADVLVGYHSFPHTDHVQCGHRAAAALASLLREERKPRVWAHKIPMVVSSEGRTTDCGVQRQLWSRIVEAESEGDVLSASLFMVQPWFDVPGLGWTLYQAGFKDDPPLPPEEVVAECWQTRHHRETAYVRPDELVAAARRMKGGPVAVSESHDATNSGAPGDSTALLRALAKERIGDGGALLFCIDPESVADCETAGVGAQVELTIGGKRDPFSEPLNARARVEAVGELAYTLSGHGGHNLPVHMGRMARVAIGEITLVLAEQTGPGSSPLLYEAAGVEPRDFKIVVAKSPEGFRRDYEPFAAGILYCSAPGCATPFLDEVDFTRTTRPLFPTDDLDDPSQAEWAGAMT